MRRKEEEKKEKKLGMDVTKERRINLKKMSTDSLITLILRPCFQYMGH